MPALPRLLTDAERYVLGQRLLFAGPRRTLQSLADEMGSSRERVRQTEQNALDKLRRSRSAARAGTAPEQVYADLVAFGRVVDRLREEDE